MLLHPQDLRRGEAREGDIRRQRGELFPADCIVEIVDRFICAAVVPQNRRTDDIILRVERDKAVHLPAGADACDLRCVKALQKLRHAGHDRAPPVLGPLLRPARLREADGIRMRDRVQDFSGFIGQQQLARRRAEIDSDIEHSCSAFQT